MAKKLKTHREVGEEFLATAKQSSAVCRYDLPPEMVWAALLDGKAWTEWLPLTDVTWTSPLPYGVGTTRTVRINNFQIDEVFFAWEEGRRMAFRFAASNMPVTAGVEDYRVVPVEGGGCELHWTGKVGGLLGFLISAGLRRGIQQGMPNLEKLIKADPARFGG